MIALPEQGAQAPPWSGNGPHTRTHTAAEACCRQVNTDSSAKKTAEGWSSVSGEAGSASRDVVANETFKEYYLVYLAVSGLGCSLWDLVP